MKLREIETERAESIEPDKSLREAAELMKEKNIGFLPVCKEGRVLGILTDRDIVVRVVAEGEDPDDVLVEDAMTMGRVWCYEDEDVETAAAKMKEHKVRRLVVMDRDGRLAGVVSLGDLADRGARGIVEEVLKQVAARRR